MISIGRTYTLKWEGSGAMLGQISKCGSFLDRLGKYLSNILFILKLLLPSDKGIGNLTS